MTAITISRQLGSLGYEVGQKVANLLGYQVMARDLINQAAHLAGSPEAALAMIDELGLLGMCPSPQACLAYRQAVEKIMREQATQGNVVLMGRAGQAILHDWPEVLHVRVIAPSQLRAERVSQRHNIPLEGAQAQIAASDSHRAKYLKRFYKVTWSDPDQYDLVINTGRMTTDTAAAIIVAALHSLPFPAKTAQTVA